MADDALSDLCSIWWVSLRNPDDVVHLESILEPFILSGLYANIIRTFQLRKSIQTCKQG